MLQFHMTPGSCSTGIHILLEELDLLFQVHIVNLVKGDNRSEAYLQLNPKGTIPTLATDDGVLTSFESIAWWLASKYPKAALIAGDVLLQAGTLEQVAHCVHQIHGQGFTRIFTPERYFIGTQTQETQKEILLEQGRAIANDGFNWIAPQIEGPYIGPKLSIADAALFYVEFWATRSDIALPTACQNHYQAMIQRPAVRRVLAEEGYRV